MSRFAIEPIEVERALHRLRLPNNPESMELQGNRNPHEAAAKAALINYFRDTGVIGDRTTVISELELRSCGRRADLVLVASDVIAVEIKTHADSLARLPEQLGTFCRAFPTVYAAVATPHLGKALTLAPDGCGIIELGSSRSGLRVQLRRKAKPFGHISSLEQSSILPAKALTRALRAAGHSPLKGARRGELTETAQSICPREVAAFVRVYLDKKYETSSRRFAEATAGRCVTADDLGLLRLWPSQPPQETALDPDHAFFRWLVEHAGRDALGAVPDDIVRQLRRRAA